MSNVSTCEHGDYDGYFDKCTNCNATGDEIVASNPAYKRCEDCEAITLEENGRFYKYESGVWLCDDCHDDRMEDD